MAGHHQHDPCVEQEQSCRRPAAEDGALRGVRCQIAGPDRGDEVRPRPDQHLDEPAEHERRGQEVDRPGGRCRAELEDPSGRDGDGDDEPQRGGGDAPARHPVPARIGRPCPPLALDDEAVHGERQGADELDARTEPRDDVGPEREPERDDRRSDQQRRDRDDGGPRGRMRLPATVGARCMSDVAMTTDRNPNTLSQACAGLSSAQRSTTGPYPASKAVARTTPVATSAIATP